MPMERPIPTARTDPIGDGLAPKRKSKPKSRAGRPLAARAHLTNEKQKPWEKADPPMSRRSWYRRQAAKRAEKEARRGHPKAT
jgi:hypothetical protein